jgi:hypothetical protein
LICCGLARRYRDAGSNRDACLRDIARASSSAFTATMSDTGSGDKRLGASRNLEFYPRDFG